MKDVELLFKDKRELVKLPVIYGDFRTMREISLRHEFFSIFIEDKKAHDNKKNSKDLFKLLT